MNEICINATDNYTKSATVTNLGWSFFSYCKEYKTYPFKHQPHKMVKYNQTISRQQPTNFLGVFDDFVRLVLKGLETFLILEKLRLKAIRLYFLENSFSYFLGNGTFQKNLLYFRRELSGLGIKIKLTLKEFLTFREMELPSYKIKNFQSLKSKLKKSVMKKSHASSDVFAIFSALKHRDILCEAEI